MCNKVVEGTVSVRAVLSTNVAPVAISDTERCNRIYLAGCVCEEGRTNMIEEILKIAS